MTIHTSESLKHHKNNSTRFSSAYSNPENEEYGYDEDEYCSPYPYEILIGPVTILLIFALAYVLR